MGSDAVIATVEAGGVAEIRLHRPEARNALSLGLVRELDGTLDRLKVDPNVKVLLLAGAGHHFAAGTDIKEMLEMTMEGALSADFSGRSRQLADMSKPVVVAVEGVALGGGCELVEMCDVVIAADTRASGIRKPPLAPCPAPAAPSGCRARSARPWRWTCC